MRPCSDGRETTMASSHTTTSRRRSACRSVERSSRDFPSPNGGLGSMMLNRRAHRAISKSLSLLATALLPLAIAGCRGSAHDDLIQKEQTTEALVFVKTTGGETLNRSWATGNLYKLSPIAPDGVVTPITNFTGAAISDPAVSFDGKKILFSMRRSGDPNRNI